MKKILTITAALVALSSTASASLVTCAPTPVNANIIDAGVAGSVSFACNPSATANNSVNGLNVTSVRVLVTLTSQVSGGAVNTLYSFTATPSNNLLAGLTGGAQPYSFTTDSNGDAVFGPVNVSNLGFVAVAGGDTVSFNVTLAGSLLNPTGSAGWNTTAQVRYDATEQASGVPEPGTMALLGSALVGLGLVARRRK